MSKKFESDLADARARASQLRIIVGDLALFDAADLGRAASTLYDLRTKLRDTERELTDVLCSLGN